MRPESSVEIEEKLQRTMKLNDTFRLGKSINFSQHSLTFSRQHEKCNNGTPHESGNSMHKLDNSMSLTNLKIIEEKSETSLEGKIDSDDDRKRKCWKTRKRSFHV